MGYQLAPAEAPLETFFLEKVHNIQNELEICGLRSYLRLIFTRGGLLNFGLMIN